MPIDLVTIEGCLFGRDLCLLVKVDLVLGFENCGAMGFVNGFMLLMAAALPWSASSLACELSLLIGKNPLNFLTLKGDVDCTV